MTHQKNGESPFQKARRRLSFGVRVIGALMRGGRPTCPYCRSEHIITIGRRYAILALCHCRKCGLSFRWPVDTSERNKKFYQRQYHQPGLTTELPTASELASLLERGFAGSEKDFTEKIGLFRSMVPTGRVLDFGCSWGYGVLQFVTLGYDAVGFEISQDRSEYGRTHLKVPIISSYEELDRFPDGSFDVIFSSHVLEHLPSLQGVFERFSRLLRPNGVLAIFVPNCGGLNAQRDGVNWGPSVSEIHTMAFDAGWYLKNMPTFGFDALAMSEPYPGSLTRSNFPLHGTRADNCDGDELGILSVRREVSCATTGLPPLPTAESRVDSARLREAKV